ATDLTGGEAGEKSDAELFWVIKNGLSFTAMPAYRDQYNDDAIWALVTYLRSLQGRVAAASPPPSIPTPTAAELAMANPQGDQIGRGAAVFFSRNCFQCHGGAGNAPGPLGYRMLPADDAELACTIRYGPNGMPAFSAERISDQDLADLIAYVRTLAQANAASGAGRPSGPPPGGFPGSPPGGQPPRD